MCFRFTALMLAVPLSIIMSSACQPATSVPTAQLTNSQTNIPDVTPETPSSGQNRIAATLEAASPSNMTSGDGFLWVISGGSIVRVDPKTNQVVGDPIQAGIQAEDIAFGDGALWVTTVASGDLGAPSETDAVSRINPETSEVLSTVKVPRAPMSVAFTPEAVWVVNFGQSGDIVIRIDPKTNQIIGDSIQTGRAPLSLAVGEESVWVANHDAHTVTRIDATNGQ